MKFSRCLLLYEFFEFKGVQLPQLAWLLTGQGVLCEKSICSKTLHQFPTKEQACRISFKSLNFWALKAVLEFSKVMNYLPYKILERCHPSLVHVHSRKYPTDGGRRTIRNKDYCTRHQFIYIKKCFEF